MDWAAFTLGAWCVAAGFAVGLWFAAGRLRGRVRLLEQDLEGTMESNARQAEMIKGARAEVIAMSEQIQDMEEEIGKQAAAYADLEEHHRDTVDSLGTAVTSWIDEILLRYRLERRIAYLEGVRARLILRNWRRNAG